MYRSFSVLAFAVMVASGACSKSNTKLADTTLNTDLQLAAQQSGTQLDSVSAAERGVAATSPNGANAAAPSTTTASSATTTHHTTHSRVHHSSAGEESSSGGTARTSSEGTVVKHTQRDAAIGAAAGAILGATTSRSKVKGGLIGAAVGGLLGGVIGNNVDKSKKPE